MHNIQNSRKPLSTVNLVGRAFLICLAFLIVPLFIHSFFQYNKENTLENQEIQLQEDDVRSTLKVIGGQMSLRIKDITSFDWDILSIPDAQPILNHLFTFKTIPVPAETPDQFAILVVGKLYVGKKVDATVAQVIVHPLSEVLELRDAPFPIHAVLNKELNDRWIEKFPIPNTDLVLVLGAEEHEVFHLHKTNFILQMVTFALIVGLVGGGLVLLLLKKLARPLNVLRSTMSRVAEGMVHSRYTKQPLGFEINEIGSYFNDTVDALLVQQKEAEEERVKKEMLEQKMQLAQSIQSDLLPKQIPSAPQLDIGAAYLPALEVGGDFYDILPLSSGKVLIVMADIADKGISACLFSLGLRSSLRALAESRGDHLDQVVKIANDLFFLDSEETSQFATVWIGLLDGIHLTYVSLGHPPAFLKRSGSLEELHSSLPAMGLVRFNDVEVKSIDLRPGDELLLFSDGATDAHDVDGGRFGLDRLKQSFLRTTHIPASEISKSILNDVQSFSRGQPQYDDLTLLVVGVLA
jgi:serine phosphatase RsbU (regulator of sigma subunit)